MFNKLIELINQTQKIILLRHIQPDFDAIGSQMALKQFILDNFSNKEVITSGKVPKEYLCIGETQNLGFEDFKDALVIITDTATKERIDIENLDYLKNSKAVFKIDHHVNVDQYGDFEIVDASFPATCELLTILFEESNLIFSKECAFRLFHGLVTDTDRFMYRNVTQRTFFAANILMQKQIDINKVYDNIYGLSLNEIKLKGYILTNFKITNNKIVYIVLTKEILKEYKISDPHKVALWVNMLGEINVANAWVMFVEGNEMCRVEFRSNKVNVREIASHFGGGGHISASGLKIENIEKHIEVIDYFEQNIDKWYV